MPFASRWCSGRSEFLSLIGIEDDTRSFERRALCLVARLWLGSGIMLLGLTEFGDVASLDVVPRSPPSLGVHALPLAMRENNAFASSRERRDVPDPPLDEPHENQPIRRTRARASDERSRRPGARRARARARARRGFETRGRGAR